MHVKNPAVTALFLTNVKRSKTADPIGEAVAATKTLYPSHNDDLTIQKAAHKLKLTMSGGPSAKQAAADRMPKYLAKLGNVSETSFMQAMNKGLRSAIDVGTHAQGLDAKKASAKPTAPTKVTLKDEIPESTCRNMASDLRHAATKKGIDPFEWAAKDPDSMLAELQSGRGKAYAEPALRKFITQFARKDDFGKPAPNRTFDDRALQQPHADKWTFLPPTTGGGVSGSKAHGTGGLIATTHDRTALGEDHAALAMAQSGYHVRQMNGVDHQLHRPLTDDALGLAATKIPDYVVTQPAHAKEPGQSFFYDCFTPDGGDLGKTLAAKASKGQARRFVINLDGTKDDISPAAVAQAVKDAHGVQGFPLQPGEHWCIEEVLAIKNGQVAQVYHAPLSKGGIGPAITTSTGGPAVAKLGLSSVGEQGFVSAAKTLSIDLFHKGKAASADTVRQSLGSVVETSVMDAIVQHYGKLDPHAQVLGSVKVVLSSDEHTLRDPDRLPKPEIDALATLGAHKGVHLISVKKDGDAYSPATDADHLAALRSFTLPKTAKSAWVEFMDPRDGATKQVPMETFQRWLGDGKEVHHALATPSDAKGTKNPMTWIAGPSTKALRAALEDLDPRVGNVFDTTGVWPR